MNETMFNLIAQADRVTEERRFEFAAMPVGWAAVLALGAVVLVCWVVVWMYRTEARRGASMVARTLLAAVRCAVILALAAILVQPVWATYLHRWIDSYCIVLVDDSSSMDLRDRYRDAGDAARLKSIMPPGQEFPLRRADVVSHLLTRDDHRLLAALSARNRVKLYTFSDAPELVSTLRAEHETEPADTPESGATASAFDGVRTEFAASGAATNVSRAIRRSTESLGGAPLAGVVLLSDGGFNQGDPDEVVARYVEEQGISLHIVGVGDASPPRNVRVTELIAPENAFKNDPFSLSAHLAAKGMAGETIAVELFEGDSTTPTETRRVSLTIDGAVEPVEFKRTRELIGRVAYRVAVEVGADESVADDNSKQRVVNVIDDKMRVLVISGSPSWEYRYVSRLLTRDGTFDVSCWLQSADTDAVLDGDTIIDALPASAEELFAYDAIVMLDPDPAEFGPGWARSVERMVVEHGGGLAYCASRKHTPQFMRDPAVDDIVQMLPVTADPEADLILNRIGHYQTRSWPIQIEPEATGHSILRQREGVGSGGDLWRDLPGIYWHYPVLRERLVATVLMRHGNPQMRNAFGSHVLCATQFVGAGRSAFVGFDSTWRWRRNGDEQFNTFWVQMLRYLVEGKLLGSKKRATLFTEGETFQMGSAVGVTARLFDARFEPLVRDSVPAYHQSGRRRQEFVLKPQPDRAGWYEGRFTPDQTGGYEISLTLRGSGETESVTATRSVQVVRPNIEILNPQMNRAALAALAGRSPGGRYYEVDEIDELADAILDRHEMTTVRSRPEQVWDRWWTLTALIGLLSVEWAVRKWVRLL